MELILNSHLLFTLQVQLIISSTKQIVSRLFFWKDHATITSQVLNDGMSLKHDLPWQ